MVLVVITCSSHVLYKQASTSLLAIDKQCVVIDSIETIQSVIELTKTRMAPIAKKGVQLRFQSAQIKENEYNE
jgi:hypothetical protein